MKKNRKRKIHIKLPLKVPQNILDYFIDYHTWAQDQKAFHKTKDEMLNYLEKVGPQWHLYAGFTSIAGSTFISTKVGISIVAHIGKGKPLVIEQYSDGMDKKRDTEWTNKKGQTFVYDWSEYKPFPDK